MPCGLRRLANLSAETKYVTRAGSEHAPGHGESGHDDGYHRHQLDKDVQAGAGSVLEGVNVFVPSFTR